MARRAKTELEKVTLNLFKGDKETLERFAPNAGWSVAARDILNERCEELRSFESEKMVVQDVPIKLSLKESSNG